MLKSIPVLDPNTGQRSILQGELVDQLAERDQVYVDSLTGEPHEAGSTLATMPTNRELYRVPRTTWHRGLAG